jgi:hypothetical protein
LAAGSVVVHHTEHVLAAVTGLGLDNLRIELGSDRVPVLGAGSARPFVDALRQAGLQPQSVPREVFRLREGMLLEAPLDAGRSGQPHDARSRVVVCVPSHSFGARYVYQAVQGGRELVGLAEYDGALESFGPLADARSYYLEAEREQIQKLLNPLLGGYIELGARSPQQDVTEVARHKLIDFLGDLAVLGRSVRARFAAFRSGHALHHELVRRLAGSGLLERERLA